MFPFLKVLDTVLIKNISLLGACLHNRRYDALVLGMPENMWEILIIGVNFRLRRSDLLLLAGLDLNKKQYWLFEMCSVFYINEFAGEKSIPYFSSLE